jgi:methylphosphotriester-DNA--protein-cysteine methyltransferase
MKRKRILVAIFVLILFVGACLTLAADYKYVGSVKSNKYHYPNCRYVQMIKPENLVTFKSAKEALEAGYVPCKVCKPPTED